MEQNYLFELILAANYLDIQPLLDLTCATMATRIKGKTPEEIRQIFNIANDFTPEDDAAFHDEKNWYEDWAANSSFASVIIAADYGNCWMKSTAL